MHDRLFVVTIDLQDMSKPEETKDWMIDLSESLSESLKKSILPETLSPINKQCIIYRVPPDIRQVDPQAYTPEVVCIGPIHRPTDDGFSDKNFWQMEDLKLEYLKAFLHRTGKNVMDFVIKLEEWENQIRCSYAVSLHHYTNEHFVRIVLVDACFIIEHFLRYHYGEEENDPILLNERLFFLVERDLLLFENQLPFFFLDDIYNFSFFGRMGDHKFPSFSSITFNYFKHYNHCKERAEEGYHHPKHFTDLLRTFMIPTSFNNGDGGKGLLLVKQIKCVYSVSQLSEAGLHFKVSIDRQKPFIDLELKKDVLTMSCFPIQDSTEMFMRNILAFEACYHLPEESYLSQYFSILDFLINQEKDVDILVREGIIINLMGDANDVVKLVNNLKNLCKPSFCKKYSTLCIDLNYFYDAHWNTYKAIFIRNYFNTPWKIASNIVAVLLLLPTLIQTICSIIQVVQGKHPK